MEIISKKMRPYIFFIIISPNDFVIYSEKMLSLVFDIFLSAKVVLHEAKQEVKSNTEKKKNYTYIGAGDSACFR